MTEPRATRTPLVLLEAATIMSGSGNGVVMVTLPWLALERTGSAATAGVVAAATALPLLFASVLSGSVVDRMGRRRSAVVSDLLSGVAVALVPIVDHAFGLDLGWLIGLAVLGACFDPAGITAREAMLPDVAKAARLPLERLNGIHEAVWGVAFLIGPGIGGLLIATVGAVNAMWAATIGFTASALLVYCIRLPGLSGPPVYPMLESTGVDPDAPGGGKRPGIWRETWDGITLVWNDRLLRAVALINMGIYATYLPLEGVLFPAWFEEQDAPERLGLLIMAMSVGGIAGALGYSAWGNRFGRRTTFVTAIVATGVGIALMALLPPYAALVLLGALVGLAYGPIEPMVNLAIQTRAPEHARGRVTGLLSSLGYAAGPAGFLLVGPLIEWVGIQATFIGVGIALLIVAISSIFIKGLRDFDDLPSTLDEHAQNNVPRPQRESARS